MKHLAFIAIAACSVPDDKFAAVDAFVGDGVIDAPPAVLSLDPPDDLAIGDVIVGQTSMPAGFSLSNTGGTDSGEIAIALDNTTVGFAITADMCSGHVLAAHHGCTFLVT